MSLARLSMPSLGLGRVPRSSSGVPGAPTLSSATIAANGLTLTLVFSEAITIGAGGSGGITVRGESPANGAVAATYTSGNGTGTLVFTLASEFYETEITKVYYTQPGNGLENGAGDDLSTFSNRSCTNNSTLYDGVLRDQSGNPVPDQNNRAIPVLL